MNEKILERIGKKFSTEYMNIKNNTDYSNMLNLGLVAVVLSQLKDIEFTKFEIK